MTVYPSSLIERTIRERIVLVGVVLQGRDADEVDAGLDELALLVDTAGADVLARLVQRRDAPDPATFLGKGKVAELHELCLAVDADTVVFDQSLTPAQQRNLEKLLGRTAIDRTAVILDIFGQNARSPEGKAQVELALLRYRLPRLRGRGVNLSQQEGRIGMRGGPGETQTEVDRRRLVRRMHKLEGELKDLDRTRAT
ncbi:MAG TPA: GTPase HflX, partial [Acidimicrobiales bacterium]|nr:GTPase HflX [Acidimicrobiales bacterium]